MHNFRNALTNSRLHDIRYVREPLIWSNRQIFPHIVQERLDRACANTGWSQLFPDATVTHLLVSCSDHQACLFVKRSVQHMLTNVLARGGWRRLGISLSSVRILWYQVGGHLWTGAVRWRWSRSVFRVEKGSLCFLENRLNRLLAGPITERVQGVVSQVWKELECLAAKVETVWRQRSKDSWFREGGRNTSFFHRLASNKFQTNLIRKIKTTDGDWVETEEGIKQCIVSNFERVYASSPWRE
ncbi:UNVERIFIED_CONTAM: hypothetical protein Sangu_2600800 [Sesamum angustifolium]|uniref:Reverse transcriptase n=1 Tax=Sesamum angustifolium TaxID=2727405 RepID=A0AAW2J5R1_9LAMI